MSGRCWQETASGIDAKGPILSCVATDANGDGDLDLFLGDVTKVDVNTYGQFYYRTGNIYGGDSQFREWFGLRLIGDGGTNKSAIGAVVETTIDGRFVRRVVDGGSGLGGQQSPILIFGAPEYDQTSDIVCTVTWPDGFQEDVIAVRGTTVTVYDSSPPVITGGGLTAMCQALPGNQANWVFIWDTSYSSDPREDKVTISDPTRSSPACQTGGVTLSNQTPGVTIEVIPLSGGGYRHTLTWHYQDCLAGCSYDAVAESSTQNADGSPRTSSTSQVRFTVYACIGGDPVPQE